MNRRHFGIATLLGVTLALIVTLLVLPQVALGKDSAASPRTDAPLRAERDENADETVASLLSADKATAAGIYGQVTYQGVPTGSIELTLQRCDYNGTFWMCSTLRNTVTQSDGSYQFTDAPSLGVDQKYRKRYRNNLNNPNYVWAWYGPDIVSYTAGSAVSGGSFDIANVPLLSPPSDVTVTLPYTFEWTPRPATPSDHYRFEMWKLDDESMVCQATVGYTDHFTFEMLPPGSVTGTQYAWDVYAISPDGGQGPSYESRRITILGPVLELAHKVYLPTIIRPLGGINGRVTYQGNPVSGINLDLRFFDGSSWSTKASAKTQSDGTYQLTGAYVFSLQANQKYLVRYLNGSSGGNVSSPNYLLSWFGPDITSYRAGTSVGGGNVDIANITLASPATGATIGSPYTFQWIRRTTTPSDSYGFWVEDINMGEYFESGPLGYINQYTLSSLPSGFSTGVQYYWGATLYMPDGGQGYSGEPWTVTFSSTGLQNTKSELHSWNALDLERLVELREARGR